MLQQRLLLLHKLRDFQGSPDETEDQDTGKQRQSPGAGYQQCFQSSLPALVFIVVESDKQVGSDTGQFPEDIQHYQVLRQHETEHRRHECQDERVHPAQLMVVLEVGR